MNPWDAEAAGSAHFRTEDIREEGEKEVWWNYLQHRREGKKEIRMQIGKNCLRQDVSVI